VARKGNALLPIVVLLFHNRGSYRCNNHCRLCKWRRNARLLTKTGIVVVWAKIVLLRFTVKRKMLWLESAINDHTRTNNPFLPPKRFSFRPTQQPQERRTTASSQPTQTAVGNGKEYTRALAATITVDLTSAEKRETRGGRHHHDLGSLIPV
jgi:hypothetical protein